MTVHEEHFEGLLYSYKLNEEMMSEFRFQDFARVMHYYKANRSNLGLSSEMLEGFDNLLERYRLTEDYNYEDALNIVGQALAEYK